MQPPEQVLAARIPSGAKAVLAAMWRAAEGEPPWIPALQRELARATGLSARQLRHWIAYLREIDAIRPETRTLLGRAFEGHSLTRTLLQPRRSASSATAGDRRVRSEKREKTHRSEGDRVEADLAQIAQHARPGDSAKDILQRLVKARAPCSDPTVAEVEGFVERVDDNVVVVRPRAGGEPRTYAVPRKTQRCVKVGDRVQVGQQLVVGNWHRVKVFRRIERMAEDLGLKGKGLRAGDIVQRWKRTREG